MTVTTLEQQHHCETNPELFFSSVDDGRMEDGRVDREDLATRLCFSCVERVRCLEGALVHREEYGVWGGMAEGERRKFKTYLIEEGYDRHEVPSGLELVASLIGFYRQQPSPAICGAMVHTMDPIDQRCFRDHLLEEGYGYGEMPTGLELVASLIAFLDGTMSTRFREAVEVGVSV